MRPTKDITAIIECETTRVNAGEYLAVLRRLYLRRNWWWITLPVASLCVLGFVNINFLVAGLFIGFVALPMLLVLIYFNYTLTHEVQWSLRPKNVTCDDSGLRLEFCDERRGMKCINWDEVTDVLVSARHVAVVLSHRKYAIVLFRRKTNAPVLK